MTRLPQWTPRLGRQLLTCLVVLTSVLAIGNLSGSSSLWAASVPSLKRDLQKALSSDRASDARKALDGLAKIATPAAVDVMVTVALSQDQYDLERHVGGLVRGLPDGEGFERACHWAKKATDYKVRVILTLALGPRHERSAFAAILTNLHDGYDSVVLAALEAVAKKGDLGAVPHLIKAVELQEKRGTTATTVGHTTRKVLLDLTGKDFRVAADWKNFWAANGKGFRKPDKKSSSKGVTSVYEEPPVIFGDEIVSKKIVFVIDISDSMKIKDPLPEEGGPAKPKKGKGRTGVDTDPKKQPKKPEKKPAIPESRARIRRVQKELIRALEHLPGDTRFSIVSFNHEVQPWKEGLVIANSKNKREAIKFVEGFKPSGQTSTDLALKAAFDITGVDTIFLLSDGKPRRNDPIPADPIRLWVRETNRFRRVRVHTVAFEQTAGEFKRFMSKLAKQNNGAYKELR